MNVLVIPWTESERGWGQRPDGFSVHFSEKQCNEYVDSHWDWYKEQYGSSTPDCYDRPGTPFWATLTKDGITDEDLLLKVLKGQSFRLFNNTLPSYIKRV